MKKLTTEEYFALRKEIEEAEDRLDAKKNELNSAHVDFAHNNWQSLVGICRKWGDIHCMIVKEEERGVFTLKVEARHMGTSVVSPVVYTEWERIEYFFKYGEPETMEDFLSVYREVMEAFNTKVDATVSQMNQKS